MVTVYNLQMFNVIYATAVTINRTPLLREPYYADIVVLSILHAHRESWAEVYAFVVMPDHLHIMFLPLEKTESGVMKSIKGYSARAINIKRGLRGSIWQEGFHSRPLIGDRFFFEQKIKYIEENPVRAGICPQPENWPWSSLRYREIFSLRL